MEKKNRNLVVGIVAIAAGSFITGFSIGEYLERRDNAIRWQTFSLLCESELKKLEKEKRELENES